MLNSLNRPGGCINVAPIDAGSPLPKAHVCCCCSTLDGIIPKLATAGAGTVTGCGMTRGFLMRRSVPIGCRGLEAGSVLDEPGDGGLLEEGVPAFSTSNVMLPPVTTTPIPINQLIKLNLTAISSSNVNIRDVSTVKGNYAEPPSTATYDIWNVK